MLFYHFTNSDREEKIEFLIELGQAYRPVPDLLSYRTARPTQQLDHCAHACQHHFTD
jgi:hypothetical protein